MRYRKKNQENSLALNCAACYIYSITSSLPDISLRCGQVVAVVTINTVHQNKENKMSVYLCGICDQCRDADYHGCNEHPNDEFSCICDACEEWNEQKKEET